MFIASEFWMKNMGYFNVKWHFYMQNNLCVPFFGEISRLIYGVKNIWKWGIQYHSYHFLRIIVIVFYKLLIIRCTLACIGLLINEQEYQWYTNSVAGAPFPHVNARKLYLHFAISQKKPFYAQISFVFQFCWCRISVIR